MTSLALAIGRGVPTARWVSAVSATAGAATLWWRKHPPACPYGQRFWVQSPHPLITRRRLHDLLTPRADERPLEVGPGTGYYSLQVTERLTPGGTADLLDMQSVLDHTMRHTAEHGLHNIAATHGRRALAAVPRPELRRRAPRCAVGEIPDQSSPATSPDSTQPMKE